MIFADMTGTEAHFLFFLGIKHRFAPWLPLARPA
jgi:hypothetical protein